jgi:TonB family protein
MRHSPLKSRLLLLPCVLLAACAGAPPSPGTPPAGKAVAAVPTLVATPLSESGPASIEARLAPKQDSEVLLRFTVKADGKVQGAKFVLSELPEETGSAVLAAFSALHFLPYQKGGEAAEHDFIYPLFFGPDAVRDRTRYFCQHADAVYRPHDRCEIITQGKWRVYRVTPDYPDSMRATPVAGAVFLSFDLDASGIPSNVKVVKSTPPGSFDTAAMVALQQWYFEPLDGSAPPPGLQHASVTINFKPPSGGY